MHTAELFSQAEKDNVKNENYSPETKTAQAKTPNNMDVNDPKLPPSCMPSPRLPPPA